MPAGLVTFTGVAHPWMCDAMGHVNVRHYAALFDDASFQLLGHIADPSLHKDGFGWADARTEIDYRRETPAGALITIRSHVEKVGNSSLTYCHVMSGSLDGVVHAQARTVTVRFNLTERRKMDLGAAARERAQALMFVGEKAGRHEAS